MFNRNAKYFHKTILIGVSFTIKGVVVTVNFYYKSSFD